MKIVDITEFYSDRGGGVRSHLSIKGHVLCQLGHQQITIAPGSEDLVSSGQVVVDEISGSQEEEAYRTPSRVIRVGGPALPYDASYHLLYRIDKVRRYILNECPDVLEIHSPYLAAIAALSTPRHSFGIRTFFWHADFIDTYLRVFVERTLHIQKSQTVLAPFWGYVRALAAACDTTFVASRWQLAKLERYGVCRLTHLPFGVDKHVFSPECRSEERRRDLMGPLADQAQTVCVSVGRFAVEKHWEVVLESFFRLRARGHSAVLVLFGDGPERAKLEQMAAGRTDVRFMGFEKNRAQLASALASADVLLHACPFETFGLSIAEAQAVGLGVVVPDQGGASEAILGANTELYPTDNAEACAHAVERLLAREPEAKKAAAHHARSAILSVEAHFSQALEHYRTLLAQRAQG